MDGGAWWATVHRVTELDMTEQLPFHFTFTFFNQFWGFPGGSEVKVSACNVGDLGLIPGSGRSCGEGKGNPLQYSCLGNPMDRGTWQFIAHGITKTQT